MVEEGTLLAHLRSDLRVDDTFPIFSPSITYPKGNRTITLHLVEGYVFVGSGLPETQYFALERKPYVAQVISSVGGPHNMRALNVISNADIESLKRQLRQMVSSDIQVDDLVRVLDGTYRALEGKVVGFDKNHESAYVYFVLRSLETVTSIPVVFLETV